MRNYILTLCLVILTSCNNNPKTSAVTESVETAPKELVVRIGLKTSVKDNFLIRLNNIKIDEFQTKNIQIKEVVSTSTGLESITANLGDNINTKSLVINLGNKPKKIDFNGIEFTYGKNSILITNSNFNKYLKLNNYVEFADNGFSIITKEIEGKSRPAFIAKQRLFNELRK